MKSLRSSKLDGTQKENKNTAQNVKSKNKVKVITNLISKQYLNGKIVKMKVKRKCYTAEALEKALHAIKEGATLRKAGDMYGIPYATLCKKLNNPDSIDKKGGPSTVLTTEEEYEIVNWLLYRAETGSPVTKDEMLNCIKSYLSKQNKTTIFKNNRPGKKWFNNFKKRHPNISLRTAQNLSLVRAEVTEENLRQWFSEVESYLENKNLKGIHASRVFNCDESNIQLHPKPDKVLVEKGARTVYKVIDAPERENATVLFMYSAQGTRAPPMILYAYKEIPKKVVENCPQDWGVGLSESGWMSTETFYEYFTRVFYPWLIKNNIQFPVVVYLDGHASHVTLPLVQYCREKKIELITLFALSTHIIQPLDIAFFHPLKDVYNKKAVPQWKTENSNRRLKKEDFPKVLKLALDLFTEEENVIMNGFKAAGLYPLNPNIVDYNVLDKKKKSKKSTLENQNIDENESLKRAVEEKEKHLEYFEKNLPPVLLHSFKNCEVSEEWTGALQNKGLFIYWLMLKKDNSGTYVLQDLLEDRQNLILNNDELTNLTIDNIEVINKSINSHESSNNTQKDQVLLEEVTVVSNEIDQSSWTELLIENPMVLNMPSEQQTFTVNHISLVDETIATNNEVDLVFNESYASCGSFASNNLDLSSEIDNAASILKEPNYQPNLSFQDNTNKNLIIRERSNETSTSEINIQTNQIELIQDNNQESIKAKYLPKNKKLKLEAKGKKKLPVVGTSEEWLKIHFDKEQGQKIKEEKLSKKRELQDKKKKLAEEKKKLENEMKLLQKKIKEESV